MESIDSDLLPKKQICNTQYTRIPNINVYKKTAFRYKVIIGKSSTSCFLKSRIASSSNAITDTYFAFTEKHNRHFEAKIRYSKLAAYDRNIFSRKYVNHLPITKSPKHAYVTR